MQSLLSQGWRTVAVFVSVLLLIVLVGGIVATIRRYQERRARRRAAGPLKVLTPRPGGYSDLLGVEFMVVVDGILD